MRNSPIINLLRKMRRAFYRFKCSVNYGILEVIFFPNDVDGWIRYSKVASEISKLGQRGLSLLDVGAGGEGISRFIDTLTNRICVIDTDVNSFNGIRKDIATICASGTHLPFRDYAFDVVCSVGVLEHIKRDSRIEFLRELKRAAKSKVVIQCVLTDSKGMYVGSECDLSLYARTRWENIKEHIQNGYLTKKTLEMEFPNAAFYGLQNANVIKALVPFQRTLLGFFAGIYYIVCLKKCDSSPPYYSCILEYNRRD